MNIAICYSGQLRTGRKCLESQRRFLGEFASADTFIHTWTKNTDPRFIGLRGVTSVPTSELDAYLEKLNPTKSLIEDPVDAGIFNVTTGHWPSAKSCFYSWRRSVELALEHERLRGKKYDVIVKLRPDVIFSEECALSSELPVEEDVFLIGKLEHNPGWRTDERVYDELFISTRSTTERALKFYTSAFETKECGHVNIAKWLIDNDILPKMAKSEKLISYRKIASKFDPLTEFEKCAVGLERLNSANPFFYRDPAVSLRHNSSYTIIQPGEKADYYS